MSVVMSITKAIKILNSYIERNKKMIEVLENPATSWNKKFDCMRELSYEMADLAKTDIKVLELIKKEFSQNVNTQRKCEIKQWMENGTS